MLLEFENAPAIRGPCPVTTVNGHGRVVGYALPAVHYTYYRPIIKSSSGRRCNRYNIHVRRNKYNTRDAR